MLDWKSASFAVVDVETTGLDKNNDRIIELGICHVSNMEIQRTESFLINPQCILSPEIVELTGIKQSELISCLPFRDQAAKIHAILSKYSLLAGFNSIGFDSHFINAELLRCGLDLGDVSWLDPLIWVRHFEEWERSRRLGAVAERLGIKPNGSLHRAGTDAEVTAQVIFHYGEDMPDDLTSLLSVQDMWKRQQEQKRANRMRQD